jgi:transmembrane sensor
MSHTRPDRRLSEEAAGWMIKLNDSDCTETDRRAFEAWLAADESHRAEYRQFERLWQTLDRLPPQRPRRLHQTLLAVLAVAGLLALLTTLAPPTERQLIATGTGERRHLLLADGSELDVNANSRIRTDYAWFSRHIEVESGEALFHVAKDRLRSFEVQAGNSRMRDIGTTFNVNRDNQQVIVAVVEGRVDVSRDGLAGPVMVEGGQQLAYAQTGDAQLSRVDTDAITAWREGRLIFKDTPLTEVIASINRQYQRQIVLSDASLGRLNVSGVFNSEDRAGLLKALQALYPLRAKEQGDVTCLVRTEK